MPDPTSPIENMLANGAGSRGQGRTFDQEILRSLYRDGNLISNLGDEGDGIHKALVPSDVTASVFPCVSSEVGSHEAGTRGIR